MDAANILKPALARGELRAIGATTLNEYQKYIEKIRLWRDDSSRYL
jgi:ATP-dependent Clp protease ATP-binding subunit ClpB